MKKRRYGRKTIVMSAAALCLLAVSSLKGVSAYFTTYVSAGGSHVVNMGSRAEIHEDVSSMTKHVSVTNVSQINDCFVRVKVFHSGELNVTYHDAGGLWTEGEGGYWYYGPILPAGQSTEILDVKIGDLPEDFDRSSFNVVVIQECTPVVYDDAGSPVADWTTVYTDYEEPPVNNGEGADQNG